MKYSFFIFIFLLPAFYLYSASLAPIAIGALLYGCSLFLFFTSPSFSLSLKRGSGALNKPKHHIFHINSNSFFINTSTQSLNQ